MPKPETLPHKRLLQLDDELKRAIDDFRYRERFPTEASAIRELIRRGLRAKAMPRTVPVLGGVSSGEARQLRRRGGSS